jgi:hypothetical protein
MQNAVGTGAQFIGMERNNTSLLCGKVLKYEILSVQMP